jgi:hypothetical protein
MSSRECGFLCTQKTQGGKGEPYKAIETPIFHIGA